MGNCHSRKLQLNVRYTLWIEWLALVMWPVLKIERGKV